MLWVLATLVPLVASVQVAQRAGFRPVCPLPADGDCENTECYWEYVEEYILTDYSVNEVARNCDPIQTKPVDTSDTGEATFHDSSAKDGWATEGLVAQCDEMETRVVLNECNADDGAAEINAIFEYTDESRTADGTAINDILTADICIYPNYSWWYWWRCRRWCPWHWHWNWHWHWCPWHHWHKHWWPYHYHWWHWHWPWCHWHCGGCWWWHWHWHWPWWKHWCRPWWHMPRWCGVSTQCDVISTIDEISFAQIDVYPYGQKVIETQVQTVVLNKCERIQRFENEMVQNSCPSQFAMALTDATATCYSMWVDATDADGNVGIQRKVYLDCDCNVVIDDGIDDCTPEETPVITSDCDDSKSNSKVKCTKVYIKTAQAGEDVLTVDAV